MTKKIVQIFISISLLLSFIIYPLQSFASNSDFSIDNSLQITFKEGKDYVSVRENVKISVNNSSYYYQSGIVQTFFIPDISSSNVKEERIFKLKDLKVTNESGNKITYSKKNDSNGIYISVTIPKTITSGDPYTIVLDFNTHDYINVSGNVTNIYVPSLPKDIVFKETGKYGLTTEYKYNTTIKVPSSLGNPVYSQPRNITNTSKDGITTFTINQNDRIGHTSWLQFGNSQYYEFKIVQVAPKTDNLTPKEISDKVPITSTNVYKISLPREYDETGQRVYIKEITPTPSSIVRIDDGNLIASFDTPANQETQIVIQGYIQLTANKKEIPDMLLEEYYSQIGSLENKSTYLSGDRYWDKDNELVKKIAEDILKDSNTISQLIINDYKYVINKFEYSQEKITNGNERIGAVNALSGGQTICMEYADTLIAILRAQGIPSRAAIGYGNDPTGIENRISNTEMLKQNIGHQWVHVWVPQIGWLSVDPTWGESQRQYIGGDLDHILWYTVSDNNNPIADTALYSADQILLTNLEAYDVYLQALSKKEFDEKKISAKSISEIYSEEDPESKLEFFVKTTLLGRIIIYTLPIATTLIITFGISLTVSKIIKRKYTKVPNQQP